MNELEMFQHIFSRLPNTVEVNVAKRHKRLPETHLEIYADNSLSDDPVSLRNADSMLFVFDADGTLIEVE